MRINPEWLGMVVAVSVVAVLFSVHLISGLVVDSVVTQPTAYNEYCQKLNLDC